VTLRNVALDIRSFQLKRVILLSE